MKQLHSCFLGRTHLLQTLGTSGLFRKSVAGKCSKEATPRGNLVGVNVARQKMTDGTPMKGSQLDQTEWVRR